MKNRAHHTGIQMSPYRAIFGSEPKIGINHNLLPIELVSSIREEDQLSKCIGNLI
jgi:hypothetical protein